VAALVRVVEVEVVERALLSGPSVLAKPAIAARTISGSSAATMSHEKRFRREAARTSSVGSGRYPSSVTSASERIRPIG
jgi:hypothetical protein